MIDIQREHLLSFSQARRHRALRSRDGRSGSLAKVYRLTSTGVRGVVLESLTLPSGKVTSLEAIDRFITKLSNPQVIELMPTPSERRRQLNRASRVLEEAGI